MTHPGRLVKVPFLFSFDPRSLFCSGGFSSSVKGICRRPSFTLERGWLTSWSRMLAGAHVTGPPRILKRRKMSLPVSFEAEKERSVVIFSVLERLCGKRGGGGRRRRRRRRVLLLHT